MMNILKNVIQIKFSKFGFSVPKTILWIGIFLLTVSCTLLAEEKLPSNSLTTWVVPSLERIGLDQPPGNKTSIDLYAARGEYESFQIGIRTSQFNLANVNVSISDLRGANNQVIPKANITLYREHYVYVSKSSEDYLENSTNPPLGKGWYADALIPFTHPETLAELTGAEIDAVPFDLPPNKNQPIWVDILVPRDTQPGQYTGTFTVTSNQGNSTGEIHLKVWNFTLPLKPSLKSSFKLAAEDKEPRKSATVELLKHKLMPFSVNPKDERELIDIWGLTSTDTGFWSGADYNNPKMKPAPSVEEFKQAAASHQPDLLLYNFTADEIGKYPALHEPIKEWASNMHQAQIANLITMPPTPSLYENALATGRSAVDIWGILPLDYGNDSTRNHINEVMQKGNQVWFYTALVQDNYSPKWLIDFKPINFRIAQGFINQSLGLTGFLYWQVDRWTNDPWNNVQTYDDLPGEGMLTYPGKQVGIEGIVPSMRLKWLRDGVEDYEYIEILKRSPKKERALQLSRSVGSDWRNWTQDTELLQSVRKQLAEEIES
jgi:hypothetical protein